MQTVKSLKSFLVQRKGLTLALMWAFFFLTLGYMLLCLLAFPTWPFWLCLAPGAVCLFLRISYGSARSTSAFSCRK